MNRFNRNKYYAAASLIIPTAAVLAWRFEPWFLAGFVVWFVAAGAVWAWCVRKEFALREARMIHVQQTLSITTLNHHRHDWMNDLQVLYGYIRMQKAEKAVQCVEQIRERMMTESKIAKLGVPSLVTFLQSFRTLTNAVELDIDIEGDLNFMELGIDGHRAAQTMQDIIDAYRLAVKPDSGDAAKLLVDLSLNENTMTASFHYDGGMKDTNEWKHKCKRAMTDSPLRAAGADIEPDNLVLHVELVK
ncbi:Spo0B domain-containing protein [Paenibacillus sepulcri]|uniref:Spo0B domain-containing protein n=1 Tax=Paenibacillus sepulcri TaxID=359917 RepID=A0ABS7CH29_9BACL|nr:Spo0B domain-containing protein [Paenibacillus sepulcri]